MSLGKRIFGIICTALSGLVTYVCITSFIDLYFYRTIGTLTQFEMGLTALGFFGAIVFGLFTLAFAWATITD